MNINMPKLDQAMEEINQVLAKYNLAGIVVIHTPGHTRQLAKLDPTYSCVQVVPNGRITLRADLKKDFGGNKAAFEERVMDTADMLKTLVVVTANVILPIGQVQHHLNHLLEQANDPKEAIIKNLNDLK